MTDWVPGLVLGLILVFLSLAVVAGVVQCNRQLDCEERGGRVERYNYRTIWVPVPCGDSCIVVVPTETHDWRCIEPLEKPIGK